MNRWIRFLLICLLFIAFIGVRYFEHLFYDPMEIYFKHAYLSEKIPPLDFPNYLFNLSLRYVINMLLSLGIIFLAFWNKRYVLFAFWFYIIAFLALLSAYLISLNTQFEHNYLFGFYIRRFLTHPLFILLLLPAFYFQKQQE